MADSAPVRPQGVLRSTQLLPALITVVTPCIIRAAERYCLVVAGCRGLDSVDFVPLRTSLRSGLGLLVVQTVRVISCFGVIGSTASPLAAVIVVVTQVSALRVVIGVGRRVR